MAARAMAITARSLAKVKSLGLSWSPGQAPRIVEIAWAHAIKLADPTPYLAGGSW